MASTRNQPESILDDAPSPRWLIAYSGGRDSTALLHLAADIAQRRPEIRLRAIHVDHGLHPHSADWAAHCRRSATRLGLECVIRRVSVDACAGRGLEDAARQVRHQMLIDTMHSEETVLMAHHRGDQAETMLLNLVRGAGIDGLSGMPRTRPFGHGWIHRPLLDCSREELSDWLQQRGIDWIEDPSNGDVRMDRNYLRHQVLPLLEERWPAVREKLGDASIHARSAAQALDQGDAQWLPVVAQGPGWSASGLSRLDDTVLARVLRQIIRQSNSPSPSQAVLDEVIGTVRSERRDAEHRVAWSGVEVRRYRDTVYVQAQPAALPSDWSRRWSGDHDLALPAGHGMLTTTGQGDWQVRFSRAEDVIESARRPGKRLSRWCQEQGVPPWLRTRLPVVLRDGRICSVGQWVIDAEAAPEKIQWIHGIAGIPSG